MFNHAKNGREKLRREHRGDHRGDRREPRQDERRENRGEKRDEGKGNSRLSATLAVRMAKAALMELTNRMPETVSSVGRTRGGWVVALEIVELERIPQSTDILASYQVELDENGELVSYQRVARYYRNQASGVED